MKPDHGAKMADIDPLPIFATLLVVTVVMLWLLVRDLWPARLQHSRPLNAFQRARRKARRGDPKACVQCADYLESGTGGAHENHGAARHYLEMAVDIYGRMARDGDGYAWLKIAEIHNRHMPPPRISDLADRAYLKALRINLRQAEAGDVNGLAFAGYQFRHGLGTISDLDRAADYLEAAAAKGHVSSMKSLGELHLAGIRGKKPDPVKAAALFRQAALNGDVEAHERVADNYFNSVGEPASRELAYFWYAWAARKGRRDAMHKLELIEKEWTPKQLRDVQARLQAWVPS